MSSGVHVHICCVYEGKAALPNSYYGTLKNTYWVRFFSEESSVNLTFLTEYEHSEKKIIWHIGWMILVGSKRSSWGCCRFSADELPVFNSHGWAYVLFHTPCLCAMGSTIWIFYHPKKCGLDKVFPYGLSLYSIDNALGNANCCMLVAKNEL